MEGRWQQILQKLKSVRCLAYCRHITSWSILCMKMKMRKNGMNDGDRKEINKLKTNINYDNLSTSMNAALPKQVRYCLYPPSRLVEGSQKKKKVTSQINILCWPMSNIRTNDRQTRPPNTT